MPPASWPSVTSGPDEKLLRESRETAQKVAALEERVTKLSTLCNALLVTFQKHTGFTEEEFIAILNDYVERTYAATPAPKWVVAAGDCAAGCGVFANRYACVGAVSKVVPVDLVIRGCPPTPTQLLQGLVWLLGGAPAAVSRPAGS